MTDHNKRAEWQGTMRCRKSRAIQALTVCGSVTTETITSRRRYSRFRPGQSRIETASVPLK
jgi:hypothetical protein